MNFDFMSAKLKHSMWKLHLRDFLDGKPGLTDSQASDHRACELGKWLYEEGLGKYAGTAGLDRLEAEHRELHRLVGLVIEHNRGGRRAEAESALVKVEESSRRVVDLLGSIEKNVKSAKVSG